MSGIFERLEARVAALEAKLAAAPVVATTPDPFAMGGLVTPPPPPPPPTVNVTAEMIMELATGLVANEQLKAQCRAHMDQMGLATLNDARPDQYPELYTRFKQVEANKPAASPSATII